MRFAVNKIHFVGIGGTGMNGIAEVLLQGDRLGHGNQRGD